MDLDKTRVLRRKKRARRVLFAAALLAAIGVAGASTLLRSKDRLIASKIDAVLSVVERKTGLSVAYDQFTTNMTSQAEVFGVRVSMKDGLTTRELGRVRRVAVEFELGHSTKAPARLRQITLDGPSGTLEIDAQGRPSLPVELLDRLREVSDDGAEPTPEPPGTTESILRAALTSMLGFEIVLRDGGLALVDHHFAKAPPGRWAMRNLGGRVFVDVLRRRLDVNLDGKLDDGGGGDFELRAMVRDDTRFVELKGRDLSLAPLAPYLPERVNVGAESRLDGRVSVTLENSSRLLPFDFDGELRHLFIEDPRLALTPIQDIRLRAKGRFTVDRDARILDLPQLRVLTGKAYMDVHGRLELPVGKKPIVEVALESKDLPIQDALDAIPSDFAPKLQGAKMEGLLNLRLDAFIDLNNPAATVFDPLVTVDGFHVVKAPAEANVPALAGSFPHKIFKNGNYVKTITVGPENPDFVPYDKLGRVLVGAVLTCEDGSFFRHNGFAMRHIMDSIRTNIRQERFARGASTVSMQTAKNLFLSQEKTASRKFQEMLLTWWLEEALPKERIFEIYMNIIEWGPKLYGIGPAARHYFGKSPSQLTALQAAYLGSIISNPVGYHRWYERGYAGNGGTLAFILRKMAERGTIPPEMVEWCEPYSPSFSKNGKPAPGGCVKPEEPEEGAEGAAGEKKDEGAKPAGDEKPAADPAPDDFAPIAPAPTDEPPPEVSPDAAAPAPLASP